MGNSCNKNNVTKVYNTFSLWVPYSGFLLVWETFGLFGLLAPKTKVKRTNLVEYHQHNSISTRVPTYFGPGGVDRRVL